MSAPSFIILPLLLYTHLAQAKVCTNSAADYKCSIQGSPHQVDLKFRYNGSQASSFSFEYQKDTNSPYAQDFFTLKTNPKKPSLKNCKVFGLIGKCVRKKLSVCSKALKASHSETYGVFNGYKYKRSVVFDLQNKRGTYTYIRKTPKASLGHQLESFKISFNNCKLIKKY